MYVCMYRTRADFLVPFLLENLPPPPPPVPCFLRAAASIAGERATIIIIVVVVQRIFRNCIERDHGRSHKRSLAKRYNLRSVPASPSPSPSLAIPFPTVADASATNRGMKLGVALLHPRTTLVVKPFGRELFYPAALNDRREGTAANWFCAWMVRRNFSTIGRGTQLLDNAREN